MRFVLRRLAFFLVTLWAAITTNFLIPRLMPGNAALSMMARYKGHVNPQALHALEIAFGVKPVPLGCYRELDFASRKQSEQQDRLLMPLTALVVADREIVTHDREVDRETLARHRRRS